MRKIIDDRRSTSTGHGGHRSPGTTRKLTLHRETLRELTAPDLDRVVGGRGETSGDWQVCYDSDQ